MGSRHRTGRIEHARARPARRARRGLLATPAVLVGGAALAILVTAVAVAGGALASSPTPAIVAAAADRGSGSSTPTPATTFPSPTATIEPSPAPEPSPSPSGPEPLLAGYQWPLPRGRITTPFGPVAGGSFVVDGLAVHDGIDIASFCGDPVHAAHDGTVLAKGRRVDAFLGWIGDVAAYDARLTAKDLWASRAVIVVIDDGNGYRSLYVHLAQSTVDVGQRVKAGDVVGYEGRTGYATGCHLHYSLFSPTGAGVFASDPQLVKRVLLPAAEVARLDPLAVLPPMSSVKVTWGWGVKPLPLPSPAAAAPYSSAPP